MNSSRISIVGSRTAAGSADYEFARDYGLPRKVCLLPVDQGKKHARGSRSNIRFDLAQGRRPGRKRVDDVGMLEGRDRYILGDDQTEFMDGPSLDHHVVWITHNEDRDACGFHLPSTDGPDGYRSKKARGTVKQLPARGSVTMKYFCGFGDSLAAIPFIGAT